MGKVLIVDHEYQFGRSLKSLLSFCDIESVYEYDEYKAIECLDRGECDVAFIDREMPHMGGVILVRKLAKKYPKIKTILITSEGTADDDPGLQALGATELLHKPININDVVKMIKQFRAENHEGTQVY